MQSFDLLRWGLDPVAFAVEALEFNPDPWQARVLRQSQRPLLLNCSRQSGKSTVASVKALHRALFFPGSLVLLVSPSQRQSGELFRKVSDFVGRLKVKPALVEDNVLSAQFMNGSRIVSLPGTEETIRGFSGAALIIEDEASRTTDALYKSIRPMLATSGGKIILMSTPHGRVGHFFEAWENGSQLWDRVLITANDCPRISKDFLAEERAELGEYFFQQEYMGQFCEQVDQVFSYADIMGSLTDEVSPLFQEETNIYGQVPCFQQ